jgi:hypothetical protein
MLDINSNNISLFTELISNFRSSYNDSVITDADIFFLIHEKTEFANAGNFFNFFSIDSLYELSTIKNNVEELIKIFPSIEDDIELLDLWTRFGEECLQEVESTPDVKLYYPEPFIASPSFVHEDL